MSVGVGFLHYLTSRKDVSLFCCFGDGESLSKQCVAKTSLQHACSVAHFSQVQLSLFYAYKHLSAVTLVLVYI